MRQTLATILVVMAGGFLLYALRLLWPRRSPASAGNAPAAPTPTAATAPVLPPRVQLEDYEIVPAAAAGEFHSLLRDLMGHQWRAVGYVLGTAVLVAMMYAFKWVEATVLFAVFQVPLAVACTYVVAPNANVAFRLPITWGLTVFLALFLFLAPRPFANSELWHATAGLVIVGFFLFWLVSAIMWSHRLLRQEKQKMQPLQMVEVMALLFVTWGATIQLTQLLLSAIFALGTQLAQNAPGVARMLRLFSLEEAAGMRYLALEIVLLGLCALTLLRMRDDKYLPRALDEFLALPADSFLAPFVVAVRIPVWIVVVMSEFFVHFVRLAREATMAFLRRFCARFAYLLIAFVLAPVLFYLGHTLMLQAFDSAAVYFNGFTGSGSPPTFVEGLAQFFLVNLAVLLSLACYALAVPLLAARYRRVAEIEFVLGLQRELIEQGKMYVRALGETFSLLGILPFAIPVVAVVLSAILPEVRMGLFAFAYAAIVLFTFLWYVRSQRAAATIDEMEEEFETEAEADEPDLEHDETLAPAEERVPETHAAMVTPEDTPTPPATPPPAA